MRYRCGAEAAATMARIVNVEDMNVWFHSCSEVAEQLAAALRDFFFPYQGATHATATGPLQWKIGMVCIPASVFCVWLRWTLNNSHQSFQEPATVMKDDYEKLNSSCIRLPKAQCSDLCFMVLCNQKFCFLSDLLLYPPPIREV